MTQQPFSRPGAIDLSGLKRPAAPVARGGASPAAGAPRGTRRSVVLPRRHRGELPDAPRRLGDRAGRAGLLLADPRAREQRRTPTTCAAADEVRRPLPGRPGRHRRRAGDRAGPADPAGAARDGDPRRPPGRAADPGRPHARRDRTLLNQLAQGLTAQGITGRHQPLAAAHPPATRRARSRSTRGTPRPSRRWRATTSTARSRSTSGSSTPTPPTPRPPPGLAMAKVLQRTQGVDLNAAREAAAANPDDVDAQTPGRRPRPARRSRRRRVHPPGRPGPAYVRRRAQPGPRAPARPVRGRRQRRPARPARPAEPRVRAVLRSRDGHDRLLPRPSRRRGVADLRRRWRAPPPRATGSSSSSRPTATTVRWPPTRWRARPSPTTAAARPRRRRPPSGWPASSGSGTPTPG